MSTDEIALRARFPEAFNRPLLARLGPLLLVAGVIGYLAYAVWFFNLPQVLHDSHWERLGIYLSQWISYDEQPEFRLGGGDITVRYPRNSSLGPNPHPDWISSDAAGRWTVEIAPGQVVSFTRTEVDVSNGGERVAVDLESGVPVVEGVAPSWVTTYEDEVVASFGFAGETRIAADRVKVRKKFLGWPNFIFDTDLPFFDRSPTEVAGLVLRGPDLEPGIPNWRLAFDNFWNNAAWQHGDVLTKLLQTVVMAFLGTLLGALVAFPLAFLAARNITPNAALNWGLKRFFDFMRSVDMLIWALFFTRAFGPGPLAGSAAIFFTETGTLGKVYSEGLENIDDRQREGVISTGANSVLVQRYGVVPQVLPVMLSQTLYQWESNTRGATIIGAVGAGGIGLKLWEAMRTNANWANVFYMVLLILAVVFIFDNVSNALRSRLIGTRS